MKQWVRFIGDVHGKFGPYKKIIQEAERSIQVGDMGVGFFEYDRFYSNLKASTNPPHDTMVKYNARFIRGNHDNPAVCKKHSQWISDGSIENIGESKVMFLGGAFSIDRECRTVAMNWWEDEQCSLSELMFHQGTNYDEKPDVMVSHDCPNWISHRFFMNAHKSYIPTRTDQALQAMFEGHQPKIHIFGHWHIALDEVVNGTRFICLPELGFIDLEL